jgi:hypothetical protein
MAACGVLASAPLDPGDGTAASAAAAAARREGIGLAVVVEDAFGGPIVGTEIARQGAGGGRSARGLVVATARVSEALHTSHEPLLIFPRLVHPNTV